MVSDPGGVLDNSLELAAGIAVLVTHMPINEERTVSIFSVGTPMEEPKHVIVIHEGNDNGRGMWRCKSGCGKSTLCAHIKSAQDELQHWIHEDPKAQHECLPGKEVEDDSDGMRGKL